MTEGGQRKTPFSDKICRFERLNLSFKGVHPSMLLEPTCILAQNQPEMQCAQVSSMDALFAKETSQERCLS